MKEAKVVFLFGDELSRSWQWKQLNLCLGSILFCELVYEDEETCIVIIYFKKKPPKIALEGDYKIYDLDESISINENDLIEEKLIIPQRSCSFPCKYFCKLIYKNKITSVANQGRGFLTTKRSAIKVLQSVLAAKYWESI